MIMIIIINIKKNFKILLKKLNKIVNFKNFTYNYIYINN